MSYNLENLDLTYLIVQTLYTWKCRSYRNTSQLHFGLFILYIFDAIYL